MLPLPALFAGKYREVGLQEAGSVTIGWGRLGSLFVVAPAVRSSSRDDEIPRRVSKDLFCRMGLLRVGGHFVAFIRCGQVEKA